MTRDEIEHRYRAYIDALNEGRLDDAAEFYDDQLRFGVQPLSREQFRDFVLKPVHETAPDGTIEIRSIVIEGDELAARLVRTGTLVREWMGIKPTGRPASFGEHAFYHLRDGRCDEVWSIIDLAAILAAAEA